MTTQRSLLILALAVISAVVAGFAAIRYSAQQPPQLPGQPDAGTAQVVVAGRDLPVGHLLTDVDLRVIRWPDNVLPTGYIPQPGVAVGRGLIRPVRVNSPILDPDLAERGSGAGLPITFPEGMRAVSVRVDEIVGVAGFVIPHTRVDVLLTMKPPTGGDQTYTQTILQNLLVLAAGQTTHRNEQGQPMTVSVVTLMVTPDQAEKLVLASAQGRIQLALRNMLDVEEIVTAGIGDGRLFELGRQAMRTQAGRSVARPRAAEPEAAVIETYRDGVRSLQRF